MDLLDEKTAYVGELLSDLLLLEMLLIPAFFLPSSISNFWAIYLS